MATNGHNEVSTRRRPAAAEVIDQALLAEGRTPNKIEQDRHIADLFENLLASGRTVDEINAGWKNKTAQEILCEYSDRLLLPVPPD